jgi:hypothetical protein
MGSQAEAPCSAPRPSRFAAMNSAAVVCTPSPCPLRMRFHAELRSPMTGPMRDALQLDLDECSGLRAGT